MPLYEYECDACGHRFEIIQKFSDPLVEKCPKCGGTVRKLLSSPAIQFKGSGWYITDYAKKDSSGGTSKSEKSEKSDKAESKAEGSADTKTDSKPAEKKSEPAPSTTKD